MQPEPQSSSIKRSIVNTRGQYLEAINKLIIYSHNNDFKNLLIDSIKANIPDDIVVENKKDFIEALIKNELPDIDLENSEITFSLSGVTLHDDKKRINRMFKDSISYILQTPSPIGFIQELDDLLYISGPISRLISLPVKDSSEEHRSVTMNLSKGDFYSVSELEIIAAQALKNEKDVTELKKAGGILFIQGGILTISDNLLDMFLLDYSDEFALIASTIPKATKKSLQLELVRSTLWELYGQIVETPKQIPVTFKSSIEAKFGVELIEPHGKPALAFTEQELTCVNTFLEINRDTATKFIKTIKKVFADDSVKRAQLSDKVVAEKRIIGLISKEAAKAGSGHVRIYPRGNCAHVELDPADFYGLSSDSENYSLFRMGYLTRNIFLQLNKEQKDNFTDLFMPRYRQNKDVLLALGASDYLTDNILLRRFTQAVLLYQQEKHLGNHERLDEAQVKFLDAFFGNEGPNTFPRLENLG